jgi:hypothetical protein
MPPCVDIARSLEQSFAPHSRFPDCRAAREIAGDPRFIHIHFGISRLTWLPTCKQLAGGDSRDRQWAPQTDKEIDISSFDGLIAFRKVKRFLSRSSQLRRASVGRAQPARRRQRVFDESLPCRLHPGLHYVFTMTSLLVPVIAGGSPPFASELTVVFGLAGFLSAAHASFYMVAACLAFWLALFVVHVAVTASGFVFERTLFRRLYAMSHTAQLRFTTGLACVIGGLCKLAWGDSSFSVAPPASLAGRLVLFGATLPVYRPFIYAAALVLPGVLALLLTQTRLGLVVRAVSSYPEMVDALGLNVRNGNSQRASRAAAPSPGARTRTA